MFALGACFGTLTGGIWITVGWRWAIFLLSGLILMACALLQILNLYTMLAGWILLGYAAGAFTVVLSKFIFEVSPPSISGPSTALMGTMCPGTIFLNYFIAHFIIPYNEDDNFETSQTWRIVFLLPVVSVTVQTFLLCVFFWLDSPKYYLNNGWDEDVKRVEDFIHKKEEHELMDMGKYEDKSIADNEEDSDSTSWLVTLSYEDLVLSQQWRALVKPHILKPLLICIFIAIFQ